MCNCSLPFQNGAHVPGSAACMFIPLSSLCSGQLTLSQMTAKEIKTTYLGGGTYLGEGGLKGGGRGGTEELIVGGGVP